MSDGTLTKLFQMFIRNYLVKIFHDSLNFFFIEIYLNTTKLKCDIVLDFVRVKTDYNTNWTKHLI